MTKRVIVGILAILLILTVLVSSCQTTPTASPTQGQAPQEILIGAPASITGMFAAFGGAPLFGRQAAVDDINKTGGVMVKQYNKKIPVKLVVADDQSDPNIAGAQTEDLILRSKVMFIAGGVEIVPFGAARSIVTEKYKIPHVFQVGPMEGWLDVRNSLPSPWQYTWVSGFTIGTPSPAGDWHASADYTINGAWKLMLDKLGSQTNKKAAVYASDDPDGKSWYQAYGPFLKSLGFDVLGVNDTSGLFPIGTTDFSSIIQKWKSFGVEVLFGNCPAPDFGTMLRQARELGFKPKIIGASRAAIDPRDIEAWGGDLAQGVVSETAWSPSFTNSPGIGGTTPKSLADRWLQNQGGKKQPVIFTLGYGYSQMQVLFDAIERAGTLDNIKVNEALKTTDINTVLNRLTYDKNNFAVTPAALMQWQSAGAGAWETPTVYSNLSFIPVDKQIIFPDSLQVALFRTVTMPA